VVVETAAARLGQRGDGGELRIPVVGHTAKSRTNARW
jgi:hypothetical protein